MNDVTFSCSTNHFQEDFIVSVLEVSNFLDIPDGKEWAIKELPGLATFSPILQLELAWKYRIDQWIEPAFRALMNIALQDINIDEAARIGLPFYNILVRTKFQIEDHRRTIAFVAPTVNKHFMCDTPSMCPHAWAAEWWNGLARQLLHPDTPLTGCQVSDGLDSVQIPGMCSSCQDRTISWVKMTGVLTREENLVDEAVQELMSWQTDEPIRANMWVAAVLEETSLSQGDSHS
jgi:hypothetical protein